MTTCTTTSFAPIRRRKSRFSNVIIIFVLIVLLVGATGYAWESHSSREHNPNIEETQARKNIEAFLAIFVTNGMGPQNKCGVTKDANEQVVRVALWIVDSSRVTGGYLVWYFTQTVGAPLKGPWGGSYDITSENFDTDRTNEYDRKNGLHWSGPIDCNTLTGGTAIPSFIQKAQP